MKKFIKVLKRENFNFLSLIFLAVKLKLRRIYYKKLFGWNVNTILGPAYIRGKRHITIGDNFNCRSNLWIEAVTEFGDQKFNPRIIIGNNFGASDFLHIAATNLVDIGNNVLVGSKVLITDHLHGDYRSDFPSSPDESPHDRKLSTERLVIIEDNVLIGDNVCILPGARIGFGAVIGANSVVTSDIPPKTIAVGIPARIVKKYCDAQKKWIGVEI
ncbi:DapH/DapD/GlmU-related protein [Janthinobacterium sp. SUN120]|uniref:DapH/DapD/GlmU-related protein n=1 Tax=Janthinobacterium sp. SUN120 TaxID=3004099 RepID=UPI0025AFFFFE|nr:DapH/DapD/GlmU-related protein [Janthinobacterium sp. SUN120]MDN2716647.1 DapH/DapD/GlmU-related protein [Janthinobacterium sp. SUN120]